jgi:Mce-associated membrane protein
VSTPSGNQRRRRIAGERRRPDQATEQAAPPAPTKPTKPAKPAKPPREPKPARPGNQWPMFAVAAVVALALVATALWLGLRSWSYDEVRTQDKVEKTEQSASAAAERAATAILSFKHTTLDADLQAATRFLTEKFGKTYSDTFTTSAKPLALETKATIAAKVLASAVVTASETRAQILVYVDQTTVSTANGGRPQVALNRTTFDMVKVDGTWLVDNFASY